MEPIELDQVECDGYILKFNSPIEFSVREEPSSDPDMRWLVARVDGFDGMAEVLGETREDLKDGISDLVVGVLQYPPLEGEQDEVYVQFFNYLKNSIESSTWAPPDNMEITGLVDGVAILEFIK